MITIQQALEIIGRNQPATQTYSANLQEASGRTLAEDVKAPEPLPRYTNSAMDGFAIRWRDYVDLEEGGSVGLAIIGESRAGRPFVSEVGPGEAVRINTGAMLPPGTDTVIAVEEVEEEEDRILVRTGIRKHQYVRFEGEEYRAGDILLERGSTLGPPSLGLLLSAGVKIVRVFRPPAVAIIVTGNELVDSDEEMLPWQIRDSNRIMLSSSVSRSGGDVSYSDRCGDRLDEIRWAIVNASEKARIILISGGVSVGPHDLVREAAAAERFKELFWKVRQKPGKPLFLARKSDMLLFGLPGNPVSALNCYAYYVHPLIQTMQGRRFSWDTVSGRLDRSIHNDGDRDLFIRVMTSRTKAGGIRVQPLMKQGSHMLSSLALASGFVLLPKGRRAQRGEEVRVHLYPWER